MPHEQELFRIVRELTSRVNDVTRRIRSLEDNYNEIINSVASLENDILNQKKEAAKIEEKFNSKFNEVISKVDELENTANEIVNQLKRFATKSEMAGVKELLDIYNPLKSRFVTRGQVEEMIGHKKR